MKDEKIHLLDRRWTEIEFGALADCGMMVNDRLLTKEWDKVTCGGCLRIIRSMTF